MIGFSLGNGESRKGLNLDLLKQKGIVYGCNALYRDFIPHTLVAVDQKMQKEITEAGYNQEVFFRTTRGGRRVLYNGEKEYKDRGWASGSSATYLMSIREKVSKVFLIGHDVQYKIPRFNNMYAGTRNYNKLGSSPNTYHHFIEQLKFVFTENPNIDYYIVSDLSLPIVNVWAGLQNLKYVSKNYLCETLQCGLSQLYKTP